MHVSKFANGSICTTNFISGWMFIDGSRDHPVWKMSLGLALAIAPTNCKPSYGGVEQYRAAIESY
jgi:hypothetical protein